MSTIPELQKTYFAQHLAIAEEQLAAFTAAAGTLADRVRFARLSRQVTAEQIRDDSGTPDDVVFVQHQAQIAWLELWTQLDAARTIVERGGRATAAFDAIRAASHDHVAGASVDFGPWRVGRQLKSQTDVPYVRTINCVIAPPTLGREAIDALSAAMPEVAVRGPLTGETAAEPIADLRRSRAVLWAMSGVGLAAAIALVLVVVLGRS